jgi:hypothetical protein
MNSFAHPPSAAIPGVHHPAILVHQILVGVLVEGQTHTTMEHKRQPRNRHKQVFCFEENCDFGEV